MSNTLFVEMIKLVPPFLEKPDLNSRPFDKYENFEINAEKQIKELEKEATPIIQKLHKEISAATYEGIAFEELEPLYRNFKKLLKELKESEEFKEFIKSNNYSDDQINSVFHAYLFKFGNHCCKNIDKSSKMVIGVFLDEIYKYLVFNDKNESDCFEAVKKVLEGRIKGRIWGGKGKNQANPLTDYTNQDIMNDTVIVQILPRIEYRLLGAQAPIILRNLLQEYADSFKGSDQKKKDMIETAIGYFDNFNKVNVEIDNINSRLADVDTFRRLKYIEERIENFKEKLKELPEFLSLNTKHQQVLNEKISKLEEAIATKKELFEQQDKEIKQVEAEAKSLQKSIIEIARVIGSKNDAQALAALISVLRNPAPLPDAIKNVSSKTLAEKLQKLASLCKKLNSDAQNVEVHFRIGSGVGPREIEVPALDKYQAMLKVMSQPDLNLLLAQMILDGRLPAGAFAAENGDNLKKLNGYLNGGEPPISSLQTSNSYGGSTVDDEIRKLNKIFNPKTNDLNAKPVSESKLLLLKDEHDRQQLIRGEKEANSKIEHEALSSILKANPRIKIAKANDVIKLNKLLKELIEGKIEIAKFAKDFHKITGHALKREEINGLVMALQAELNNGNSPDALNTGRFKQIETKFAEAIKLLKPHKHFGGDKLEAIKSKFSIGSISIKPNTEMFDAMSKMAENLKEQFQVLNTAKKAINVTKTLERLEPAKAAEHKVALEQFRHTKHAAASYFSNVLSILKQEHAEVKRAIRACEKQLATSSQDMQVQREVGNNLQALEAKLASVNEVTVKMQAALNELSIGSKTIDKLKANFSDLHDSLRGSEPKLKEVKAAQAAFGSTIIEGKVSHNPLFQPDATTKASNNAAQSSGLIEKQVDKNQSWQPNPFHK